MWSNFMHWFTLYEDYFRGEGDWWVNKTNCEGILEMAQFWRHFNYNLPMQDCQ